MLNSLTMSFKAKHWMKALDELRKNPIDFVKLLDSDDHKITLIEMKGPKGSPYENGIFELKFESIRNYPMKPPKVRFNTNIFHININHRGQICTDLLSDNWKPNSSTLDVILHHIYEILKDPQTDSAINDQAADLFIGNKKKYFIIAKEWTQKYAINNQNNNQQNQNMESFAKLKSFDNENNENNDNNDNNDEKVSFGCEICDF